VSWNTTAYFSWKVQVKDQIHIMHNWLKMVCTLKSLFLILPAQVQ
jgi:hypothetical protein